MILTGSEIKKYISTGDIQISPFDENNITTNSYDYRIDKNLFEISDTYVDPKLKTNIREIKFNEEGFILSPNKTYLANTCEEMGSSMFVPTLIGNSSLGRLGLFLQITADLGNLGTIQKWTLELKAVQPIKIYPYMIIGQISFWRTLGKQELTYCGKYSNFQIGQRSEIYKEL